MDTLEEILQRGRETGTRIAQQIVDLLELGVIGRVLALLPFGTRRLPFEEVAVGAADAVHLYACPEKTCPGELPGRIRLQHLLAMEASGVRIRDIVPGRNKARLSGGKP